MDSPLAKRRTTSAARDDEDFDPRRSELQPLTGSKPRPSDERLFAEEDDLSADDDSGLLMHDAAAAGSSPGVMRRWRERRRRRNGGVDSESGGPMETCLVLLTAYATIVVRARAICLRFLGLFFLSLERLLVIPGAVDDADGDGAARDRALHLDAAAPAARPADRATLPLLPACLVPEGVRRLPGLRATPPEQLLLLDAHVLPDVTARAISLSRGSSTDIFSESLLVLLSIAASVCHGRSVS